MKSVFGETHDSSNKTVRPHSVNDDHETDPAIGARVKKSLNGSSTPTSSSMFSPALSFHQFSFHLADEQRIGSIEDAEQLRHFFFELLPFPHFQRPRETLAVKFLT